MKKLFFIIGLFLLTSCATLTKIAPEETYYGIDFRRFAEKEFLFSTENYNDSHLLLGIVTMEIYPGATYKIDSDKIYYGNNTATHKWFYENANTITADSALNKIYNKSIEFNGNAFVNLKIESIIKIVNRNDKGKSISNTANVSGIKITGNIIKRYVKSK